MDADEVVEVIDDRFVPEDVRVTVGAVVRWDFSPAGQAHNIVFDDGGPNSEIMQDGQWHRTFDTPGIYPYRCTIHPGMVGQINVESGSDGPT